ncbi:uncharacterized protein LOC131431586 isoform X1 [Malaya genurostris]|uniref:uncharacterized protein LOC131431586 isoform X1 n=1 Tax=Malaya genurostris TaxID=325434 RepID=UPI0026F38633|nr:uncharacterized protein LOC131431586 isoform X1 [Malaya genurostris]
MQYTNSQNEHPDVDVNISIVDILDYVGESVRPIKEGFAVYTANHIVCIGYRKIEQATVEVTGYVTQTSHPGLAPHQIKLNLEPEISKWMLKCTCKAGTAKCKHIIACLLHIEKHRTLEYLSCTDITQAWGITKSAKKAPWGAKRITELCCVNQSKSLKTTDSKTEEQLLSTSFNCIMSVSRASAISKHMEGRHLNIPNTYANRAIQSTSEISNVTQYINATELTTCLRRSTSGVVIRPYEMSTIQFDYFDQYIQVDVDMSVRMALETKDQNTNSWKINRTKRITASSAYKLFTYLRNKNPDWSKKISQYWDIRNLKLEATKYGKDTEPLAFECYKIKRNPNIKKCGLVIHPDESWIAGSPDGIDPVSNILLEIKCPMNKDASLNDIMNCASVKVFIKQDFQSSYYLNKRHCYYCQVQINMWLLNLDYCDFVLYSTKDNDFNVIEVIFDRDYVTTVINDLKTLYFNRMLLKLIEDNCSSKC